MKTQKNLENNGRQNNILDYTIAPPVAYRIRDIASWNKMQKF